MTIALPELPDNPCLFPDPLQALDHPNGLLAFGGDLSPTRILSGYRLGIFPWFNPGEPILWWSPDPRGVAVPGQIHLSRSTQKWLRKTPLSIRCNTAFAEVLAGCAAPRPYQTGTWLTAQMRAAYMQLHQLGVAHSVEVWLDDALIGGLYGLTVGSIFCGESMFSRQTNASKAAFAALHQRLSGHASLIDCQLLNPHLAQLGVKEMDRETFLAILDSQKDRHLPDSLFAPGEWPCP
ncbi:leucyl/phenylalanyl-tRNA--protein transferase [Gallaecimonas sp. GXIMD1310]|uniref:leucyl/phenylalanyl-tRNA--protein transferase n=1 Tax=Gallaecimonas sp. GXIMD1310 TaxID=3131926 RepID=UPI003252459E